MSPTVPLSPDFFVVRWRRLSAARRYNERKRRSATRLAYEAPTARARDAHELIDLHSRFGARANIKADDGGDTQSCIAKILNFFLASNFA